MDCLDEKARLVLTGNDRGGYTVPTEGLYPNQWNWDSAFAALGFSTFHNDRAWREIETLFSGQWSDGMVPHILFHKANADYFPGPEIWCGAGPIPSSGITQPPVVSSFARRIYEKDAASGRSRLERLYPNMLAWHRWFMRWRLDEGAVCATHPWESGRDNAPDWDTALSRIDPTQVGNYQRRDTDFVAAEMRPENEEYDRYIWLVNLGSRLGWDQQKMLEENPFRVADPTLTFICLRAARDILKTGLEFNLDVSDLESDIKVLEDGAETLWNEHLGCYDSRTVPGNFNNVRSSAAHLCWYAGINNEEHLPALRRALHQVQYPVASFDPDYEKFDELRYWRGPTWAFMNYLIVIGLEEFGLDEAEHLKESTRSLIGRSGFFEYFSPLNGDAAGGGSFAWTAAVWLAWAEESEEDR